MKTDKFENTIRRKLESISPEFHEDDWTKMQDYMHAHTPPTFWQQYSSWFGYAAAAAVTTVLVFLYTNQRSQNNNLLSDVKKLKSEIEVIKNTPPVVQKTDTVYIVQHKEADRYEPGYQVSDRKEQEFTARNDTKEQSLKDPDFTQEPGAGNKANQVLQPEGHSVDTQAANAASEKTLKHQFNQTVPFRKKTDAYLANREKSQELKDNTGPGSSMSGTSGYMLNTNPAAREKVLDDQFDIPAIPSPAAQTGYAAASREMHYGLLHRMAPTEVRKEMLAAYSVKKPEATRITESAKKAESVTKAERAIPKFNLKVPYRFGFAQQWERKNQVKTVLGEVLVSKNISITTGASWVKIKPVDFHSETVYNKRTRRDFKKDHYLPMALKIVNLNIKSSLVQIPLTVAFRSNLKNDFAYFAGVGTNITVQSKRDITYDCYFSFPGPGPKPNPNELVFREKTTEKMDLKLVNSINFSAGIEKSWHPLVIQAEGYLYSYFTPLSPQSPRTGPGFKIKLLYQIGKKM
jgi:hypothetical protein